MHFFTFSRYALLLCALGASLNVYPGWCDVTGTFKAGHEPFEEAMLKILKKFDDVIAWRTNKKQQIFFSNMRTILNEQTSAAIDRFDSKISNIKRQLPFYVVGLVLLCASMGLGWKALNAHLDNTSQNTQEMQVEHDKIKSKIKVSLAFLVASIGILYAT